MLQGVRGRNSDNALILSQLGWEPTVKLHDGLKITYFWIKKQVPLARSQLLVSAMPQSGIRDYHDAPSSDLCPSRYANVLRCTP